MSSAPTRNRKSIKPSPGAYRDLPRPAADNNTATLTRCRAMTTLSADLLRQRAGGWSH